jgi:hypothetical protein
VLWRRMIANATVDDLYKGAIPEGTTISIQYEDERPPTRILPGVSIGERALLFLKVTPPSIYTFADKFMRTIRFTSLPPQHANTGLPKLESALASVVRGTNREDRVNALMLLQGFDRLSSQTIRDVEPLGESDDPAIEFGAIAVLLKTKAPATVELLRKRLAEYSGSAEPIALVNIGSELGQIDDQRALVSIESLADSKYLSIRLGAMDALRRMKSDRSAPTLIRKLDDPDRNVQYIALITLAEMFNKQGEYAPSMYVFDQNPVYYVQLWKAWASENSRQ